MGNHVLLQATLVLVTLIADLTELLLYFEMYPVPVMPQGAAVSEKVAAKFATVSFLLGGFVQRLLVADDIFQSGERRFTNFADVIGFRVFLLMDE